MDMLHLLFGGGVKLLLLSDIFLSILDGAVDFLQKLVKSKTLYVVDELLDRAQTFV